MGIGGWKLCHVINAGAIVISRRGKCNLINTKLLSQQEAIPACLVRSYSLLSVSYFSYACYELIEVKKYSIPLGLIHVHPRSQAGDFANVT